MREDTGEKETEGRGNENLQHTDLYLCAFYFFKMLSHRTSAVKRVQRGYLPVIADNISAEYLLPSVFLLLPLLISLLFFAVSAISGFRDLGQSQAKCCSVTLLFMHMLLVAVVSLLFSLPQQVLKQILSVSLSRFLFFS